MSAMVCRSVLFAGCLERKRKQSKKLVKALFESEKTMIFKMRSPISFIRSAVAHQLCRLQTQFAGAKLKI
jgi:16S rRNA C1402 (ribose-2'-O) methylase RsmI